MKNIEFIDRMKGLGIIAVMIGHLAFPMWLINIVYFFHMPLFFFCSGYTSKDRTIVEIFKNSIPLLYSYSFYAIICYIVGSIIRHEFIDLSIYLFSSSAISELPYFIVMWFPIALVVSKILVHILTKYFSRMMTYIIIIIFIALLYITQTYTDVLYYTPLCIGQGLLLSIFMMLGKLVKEKDILKSAKEKMNSIKEYIIPILYLLFCVGAVVYLDGDIVKISNFQKLKIDLPFSYIGAVIGIYAIYKLSLLLNLELLSRFGRYSYFIMASHLLLFRIINLILSRIGYTSFLAITVLILSFLMYIISIFTIERLQITNKIANQTLYLLILKKINPNG